VIGRIARSSVADRAAANSLPTIRASRAMVSRLTCRADRLAASRSLNVLRAPGSAGSAEPAIAKIHCVEATRCIEVSGAAQRQLVVTIPLRD
jgi:hypothetical protein